MALKVMRFEGQGPSLGVFPPWKQGLTSPLISWTLRSVLHTGRCPAPRYQGLTELDWESGILMPGPTLLAIVFLFTRWHFHTCMHCTWSYLCFPSLPPFTSLSLAPTRPSPSWLPKFFTIITIVVIIFILLPSDSVRADHMWAGIDHPLGHG